MNDTNKNTSKLNPAIKEKAEELFSLIEEDMEINAIDAEDIANEIGDFIKSSTAFNELIWADRIAKTTSENAEFDLERSTWHMDDEALGKFCDLAQYSSKAIEQLEASDVNGHAFNLTVRDLKGVVPEIKSTLEQELMSRGRSYGEEIKELKEA